MLCALVHCKKAIQVDKLLETLSEIKEFSTFNDLRNHFYSLSKKLFINKKGGYAELNPYIKQVSYNNLKLDKKETIDILNKHPFFINQLENPIFDDIKTLLSNQDEKGILKLAQIKRRDKLYKSAIKLLHVAEYKILESNLMFFSINS